MNATIQLARLRAGSTSWLAGAAGLGYVVCAGVENMELLRSPPPWR